MCVVARADNAHTPVIRDIFEEHLEEAAIHWSRRDQAVSAPHYTLDTLGLLDQRIDAHLDGLRLDLNIAWDVSQELFSFKTAGEVFTAACIAFESGEVSRIGEFCKAASANIEPARGLISALGWT